MSEGRVVIDRRWLHSDLVQDQDVLSFVLAHEVAHQFDTAGSRYESYSCAHIHTDATGLLLLGIARISFNYEAFSRSSVGSLLRRGGLRAVPWAYP